MKMKYLSPFSSEYLRDRLIYNPDTGLLFWKEYQLKGNSWNGRFAGQEAFTALSAKGYKSGAIDCRGLLAHRVIFCMVTGRWPANQIDHIDHDRSNNRWPNLREATAAENMKNVSLYVSNKSGVQGVYWAKKSRKWHAQIKVNREMHNLGYFTDFNDAVAVRLAAEREHGFHENHGAVQ